MVEPAKKAFVIGHPVGHSRSPLIHRHWLERFGIHGGYERIDVPPAELAGFARDLPASGFVGGNVTIPHKEAVCRLVARVDPAAELIGAANTLWLEDGRVCADNTDAEGFAANLDAHAPDWRQVDSALVLGAGGAARAVLFALVEAGVPAIRLVNRTRARAQELADRFGSPVGAYDWSGIDELAPVSALVVNTTSLGMNGEGGVPLDVELLPESAIVADIVYAPLMTPLLIAAERRGLKFVDGLGMLLHQAVPGFEKWFGRRPQVTDELRALIVADLENRP